MARLLALFLSLALVASIVTPGDLVGRCDGMGAASGCCPMVEAVAEALPSEETCCCGQPNEPEPAPVLPAGDRVGLIEGAVRPEPARPAILWSYAPTDAPAGAWRAAPVLPFAGAPPPRERSCIILT